jgi:hypothetical protein
MSGVDISAASISIRSRSAYVINVRAVNHVLKEKPTSAASNRAAV